MGKATDDLRSTLQKLEADLQRLRSRRAQRAPTGPIPAGREHLTPAQPAASAPARRPSASPYAYAVLAAIAASAAAGIDQGNRLVTLAGVVGLAVFMGWVLKNSGAAGPAPTGDLVRRVAALERRVASLSMGSGSGAGQEIEEELQEVRTILKALLAALDEPGGEGQENPQ